MLAGELARSGVPAFALAPREKQVAVASDVTSADGVTDLAQKTFDAQVVSRRPLALVAAREEEG